LKELIKTISKEDLKELFKDMADEEFLALKS
jgi:rubrerythrin